MKYIVPFSRNNNLIESTVFVVTRINYYRRNQYFIGSIYMYIYVMLNIIHVHCEEIGRFGSAKAFTINY
jgi:hypothetical protein